MVSHFVGYWQWQIVLYGYLGRQPFYVMNAARNKMAIYKILFDRADSRAILAKA
jgi:hypothetical protein